MIERMHGVYLRHAYVLCVTATSREAAVPWPHGLAWLCIAYRLVQCPFLLLPANPNPTNRPAEYM
jgi:hypothetical protein